MIAAAEPIDLSPPADTRWGGPLTLALIAHGLLVAALTWGVSWKPDHTEMAVEAELWSRLPQEAAPRLVVPEQPTQPPEPAPQPVKPPPPPPPPPAPPRPAPPPPAPSAERADIALEAKKKAEEKRKAEALKLAEEKKKAEALKRAEAKKLEAQKLAEQKKAQELAERKKREQAQADAERKKREDAAKAAKAAEDKRREAQLAADRQKNLERMMGQAGATGGATARGTAQQSSGPSASYGGRVAARIKPNIVFTDVVNGNPRAEVEIRLLPDGTIVASKLTQSSGNKAWDDAVLRAVERTATLPRDENGKVPSNLVIGFRPQD